MPVKVLVVEDEPDLEFLIDRRFRHKVQAGKFRFIFARNGLKALEQLETNPEVSVVLSDIKMPQMDGLKLLTELNVHYPLLRTIIISAYGDTKNIRTAMNRGAYDFLTKPIDFKDLEITLEKTIRHVQQLRDEMTERKRAKDELEKHRDRFEELVEERTMELVVINEALQQEIAERKKVEEALRESEEQYRTLFENLQDVFYRIDRAGNILLVSPSIIQLLGYPEEEAIRLNLGKDVFVLPEQWNEFMSLIEKNGYIHGFEVLLKRHDGSYRWGNASAQYYTNKEGHVLGVEGIIRDISERKQAEAELIAAHNELKEKNEQLYELNASKDRFFSIISHDLRSPFTAILGFTELIATNIDTYSKHEIRHQIDRLKTAAEKLYALLENLLTWSRIQRGAMKYNPTFIDLFDVAEENMVIFLPKAEHKDIALRNVIQKDTRVYADYGMINTIMRNLISNALKFTNAGGSITVSAADLDRCVEVAVSDTGCGIPREGLTKLFRIDATYSGVGTAGEQGTGLGLILCKELVEQHDGEIWVESEVGKGTTFSFTVPRART